MSDEELVSAEVLVGLGEQRQRYTASGDPEVVAAFLRACADQLDPPKRPTRAQRVW